MLKTLNATTDCYNGNCLFLSASRGVMSLVPLIFIVIQIDALLTGELIFKLHLQYIWKLFRFFSLFAWELSQQRVIPLI